MTIKEFITANPERLANWSDDDHVIKIKKPNGTFDLVCFADMDRLWTQQRAEKLMPGFLQWEVAQDRLTREEIEEFVKHRDAKL